MKTFLLLLALAALSATSCHRPDKLEECLGSCTTVVGRLVTANGQQPLSGAQVDIKWIYGSPGWPKSKLKAQTTTDANGNYRVSFFIQDSELEEGFFEAVYVVDKQRYYTIGEDIVALYDAKRDTLLQLGSYVIPRKAYVRLAITNAAELPAYAFMSDFNTCYGQNNVFSSRIQGGGPVVFWSGLPTENPLPVAGDQPVIVRGYKTKDGVVTRTADSLYIPAGTTQSYTVTY